MTIEQCIFADNVMTHDYYCVMRVPEGPRLFVAPQPEMLGIPRHGSEVPSALSASRYGLDLGPF